MSLQPRRVRRIWSGGGDNLGCITIWHGWNVANSWKIHRVLCNSNQQRRREIHMATKAGTHEGQQTWEALCGLICLRLWRKYWQTAKLTLRLRNDNVGALTLYAQTKGRSPAHTLLAREFALDLGKAQYRPAVAEHLPGAVNVVCDVLSRRYQPGVDFKLPVQLAKARAVVPPARLLKWWKTLSWVGKTVTGRANRARSG